MNTAKRYLIGGVLAIFFLNHLIIFAGEEDKQLKTFEFNSDLSFQIQEWKKGKLIIIK